MDFEANNYSLWENLTIVDYWTKNRRLINNILWWYDLVASLIGIGFNSICIKNLSRLQERQTHRALFSIAMSNIFTLVLILMPHLTSSLKYLQEPLYSVAYCKVYTFLLHSFSAFATWCWLLLAGIRYLAIFHPYTHYKFKHCTLWRFVLVLLTLCAGFELWTLVVTTRRDGTFYCDIDENLISFEDFKKLNIAEILFSYLLPFFLIFTADFAVFCRIYLCAAKSGLQKIISNGVSQNSYYGHSMAMIVPKSYAKRFTRRRHQTFLRLIFLTSLNLTLNLPSCIVRLLNTFDSTGSWLPHPYNDIVQKLTYALSYTHYALSYVYVQVLINSRKQSKSFRVRKQLPLDRVLV